MVRDALLLKSGVVGEGRATASRCDGLLGFPSRGGLVEAHEEYMPQGHPPNCHLFSPPTYWRALLPVEDEDDSRGTCAGRHMFVLFVAVVGVGRGTHVRMKQRVAIE